LLVHMLAIHQSFFDVHNFSGMFFLLLTRMIRIGFRHIQMWSSDSTQTNSMLFVHEMCRFTTIVTKKVNTKEMQLAMNIKTLHGK